MQIVERNKPSIFFVDMHKKFLEKFRTEPFENCILGTLLLDESFFEKIKGKVSVEMFSPKNKSLASVIFEMLDLGEKLRKFSVLQCAKDKGIKTITVNDIEQMIYHASIDEFEKSIESLVENWFGYRKSINAAIFIADIENGMDVKIATQKRDKADNEIEAILEMSDSNEDNFAEQVDDSYNHIVNRARNNDELEGISTGFGDIDLATGGFLNSNLYCIGGESGGGKSTLAIQMLMQAAYSGLQTDFYSLEMSSRQIIPKLFSAKTGVSTKNMKLGNIDDSDIEDIENVAKFLKEHTKLKIIDDTFHIDLIERKAKIRKKKNDTRLIVIDHLDLIESNEKGNLSDIFYAICYKLKRLARKLNIPIIYLAQTNKDKIARANKKPVQSDLYFGGGARAADLVFMPYRADLEEGSNFFSDELPCSVCIVKDRETNMLGEYKRLFVDRFNLYCEIDSYSGKAITPDFYEKANKTQFTQQVKSSENIITRGQIKQSNTQNIGDAIRLLHGGLMNDKESERILKFIDNTESDNDLKIYLSQGIARMNELGYYEDANTIYEKVKFFIDEIPF